MKVIHLFGDSFFRGYTLGAFAETIDPANPLYPLRSLWSMGNLLLEANGAPVRFAWRSLGTFTDPGLATAVGAYASMYVDPGDWVIFEDAGQSSEDPDAYQASLCGLLDAVCTNQPKANRAVMTMFDYTPAALDSQHDTTFGTRTMNDAVRAVASARNVPCIDMNAKMDLWRYSAMTADGVDAVLPDGVHPNVWGAMRMLGAVIALTGAATWLLSYKALVQLARANWQALGYGTTNPNWTVDRAEAYCSVVTQA